MYKLTFTPAAESSCCRPRTSILSLRPTSSSTMAAPLGGEKITFWRQIVDPGAVTPALANYPWPGSGTPEDPFIVSWIDSDPRNPVLWSSLKKWTITFLVGFATLALALISSAYTGGIDQMIAQFRVGEEVITLGVSLFVLGFAIGPLLWAPLSEMFGRQPVFFVSYMCLAAFNAGCAGAPNIWSLIILRFFAGSLGSAPLTNAGGIIADMFSASHRGLALGVFALMPFLGPVIGPIIGGFLGMTEGWRWVEGFLAIFSGAVWILLSFTLPETYGPVLLRKRAARLSAHTGNVYISRVEADVGPFRFWPVLKVSLMRPWLLLFREPIVMLLSLYMAIVYGTLYMLFAAFPIVFEIHRHWNQGVGGLSFIGVLVGMLFAMAANIYDNHRYTFLSAKYHGFAPPEVRLVNCMIGGIALPIGLFWFAWTNSPSIHWSVSIIGSAPFGFGMVLVFLGIMNYLIDSYTIYAASVLAANSVLRSAFGAAFPLFTTYMYNGIGIHWASSIPAFLSVLCVPMPFIFYRYGPAIRARCKYSAQAAEFMRRLQDGTHAAQKEKEGQQENQKGDDEDAKTRADDYEPPNPADDAGVEAKELTRPPTAHSHRKSVSAMSEKMQQLQRTRSQRSAASRKRDEYSDNPYDLDLTHTRSPEA